MTREQVDRILAEYDFTPDPSADRVLESVRAAVFLEAVFDMQLSDAEIDPALLGSADAVRALVLSKMDAA